MNWSRIKSIFIVVFFLLNSFLGYQLWEKQTKKIELAQIYESSIDELLLMKNISLETELNLEQPELSQLNVQFLAYTFRDLALLEGQNIVLEDHKIISKLIQAYPLPEPWEETLFFQEFVKEEIMRGEQYGYDPRDGKGLVYLQKVEGYPIFGGSLEFQINDQQQVTGYEQVYYHVINQATQQPVISSFSSLRTLLDNQVLPSESIIKDIALGYFGQIYDAESQVLTPTWRIVIEQEENRLEYFVNAYTGAIELQPVLE